MLCGLASRLKIKDSERDIGVVVPIIKVLVADEQRAAHCARSGVRNAHTGAVRKRAPGATPMLLPRRRVTIGIVDPVCATAWRSRR